MLVKKETIERVRMIGLGGVGGCLLPSLLRYLTYAHPGCEISLLDGDKFEPKNLERQSFRRIGNKAEVKAEEVRPDFPDLTILAYPEFLTEDNVVRYLREGDVVLTGVDNNPTKRLLSERGEELDNVCIISGGNHYTDGSIQIFVRQDGLNVTAPLAHPEWYPDVATVMPNDKHPAELGCDDVVESVPQLLFMNNLVAAHMLSALYAYEQGAVRHDCVYFDMLSGSARPCHWSNPVQIPKIVRSQGDM